MDARRFIRFIRLLLLTAALPSMTLFHGNTARASETWTLTVDYRSEAEGAGFRTLTTATGRFSLRVDDTRRLSGDGRLSVINDMKTGISTSRAAGQGPMTVTGTFDGRYLTVSLEGLVTAAGETVYSDPILPPQPYTHPLNGPDVSGGIVIERRNGGTTTNTTRAGGGAAFQVTTATTCSLSDGPSVADPPAKPAAPAGADLWTLELACVHHRKNGEKTFTAEGSVEFPLPPGDGPVSGEGPMKVTADIPPSTTTGRLLLDGRLDGDRLTVVTTMHATKVRISDPAVVFNGRASGDRYLGVTPNAGVILDLKDGAETVIDLPVPDGTATVTFRLKGHRRETWRVAVTGWRTELRGSGRVVYGPRVNWSMEVMVTLRDGDYEQGSGKSAVGKIEPFAKPPGLCTAKAVPMDYRTGDGALHKTPYVNRPAYPVSGVKIGPRTWRLELAKAKQEPFFVLGFECVLNPQVARANHIDLTKRVKIWRDQLFGYYPLLADVTLVKGWNSRSGSPLAQDGQAITVTRIR